MPAPSLRRKVSRLYRARIEVNVTDLRAGLVTIADDLDEWRDAGLPPARDPLAVVERAVALSFVGWWSALPDAA